MMGNIPKVLNFNCLFLKLNWFIYNYTFGLFGVGYHSE